MKVTNELGMLKSNLSFIVTEYDKAQSKRKYYNAYALPQYLNAIDSVIERVWEGMSVNDALNTVFDDALLYYIVRELKAKTART